MLKQVTTTSYVYLSAIAGGATTTVSLSARLNEPHQLVYLPVPFWAVLIAVVVAVIAGAWLNTLTERSKAIASKSQMFATSIVVGLLVAFIVMPMFIIQPNPNQMILVAFGSSFFGVGLVFIIADIWQKMQASDKLKDGLTSAIIDAILTRLKLLPEFFSLIAKFISGGK